MPKLMRPIVPALLLLLAATAAISQTQRAITTPAQVPAVTQLAPYTSAAGRFTINFPPGNVEPSTQQVPAGGASLTQYIFAVEADNGGTAYMASYVDYSAALSDGMAALERSRDGFAQAVKCTVTSDMAFDLNGVPGRAFTCANSDFHFSAHAFVQGNRLYQILVVSKPDHPATYSDEFLNSFRIN